MPFIAPPYTDQRRIGAFLPLSSGEVAMPLDIDGEGLPHRSPSPLPPSPRKGDIMVEGAAHLWGAQACSYPRYTLSVTCGDSSPKGGAKA